MKKLLSSLFIILLVSCSNSDDVDNVCTECSASLNGMTTTPAQFCGSKEEVEKFEKRYRDINKNVSVTCTRSNK